MNSDFTMPAAMSSTRARVPVRRSTVSNVRQDAYERLKTAIINQEYKPGEFVGISELARHLGVSRTPIREALSVLERDFLVKLVDMRGVWICTLTVDEIVQLNQMREVIDGLAARLAADTMPDEVISALEQKFKALIADTDYPDPDRQSDASDELHSAITSYCGNTYVQSQWAHLNNAFLRVKRLGWDVWRRCIDRKEVSQRRLDEHLAILAALSQRSPEGAEKAARHHISTATSDLLKYMRAPSWTK